MGPGPREIAGKGRWGLLGRPGVPRPIGLAGAVVLGVGSLFALGPGAAPVVADSVPCGPSPVPAFFSDDAIQPPVATPDRHGHYTLTAHLGEHSFHSGWPAVRTLGYSAP